MQFINMFCVWMAIIVIISGIYILKTWFDISHLLEKFQKLEQLKRFEEVRKQREEEKKISLEIPKELEDFIDEFLKDNHR